MIRSTRRIYSAISNDVVIDDETLHTVMTEGEGIENNRPLCAFSDSHHDLDVLTPNKILLLKSNDVHVDPEPNNNQYLRRWRRVCHLSRTFRKRWVRENLSALHNRQKWHKICRNLKVGDLVMVMSENIGSVNCPMAIVTEVFTQHDGLVQDITVKMSKGLLKRDVRKLCLLEGADD